MWGRQAALPRHAVPPTTEPRPSREREADTHSWEWGTPSKRHRIDAPLVPSSAPPLLPPPSCRCRRRLPAAAGIVRPLVRRLGLLTTAWCAMQPTPRGSARHPREHWRRACPAAGARSRRGGGGEKGGVPRVGGRRRGGRRRRPTRAVGGFGWGGRRLRHARGDGWGGLGGSERRRGTVCLATCRGWSAAGGGRVGHSRMRVSYGWARHVRAVVDGRVGTTWGPATVPAWSVSG